MANTTNFSVRMDSDIKKQCETLYGELGMNLTTAFTVFAKKAVRERRIPFSLDAGSIYTETITEEYLDRAIAAMDAGMGKEHDLLEVDD